MNWAVHFLLYFQIQITDGGEGKCTAIFKVAPEHLNRGGFLHGGFTATIVDMVTTYALMTKPCPPGVSVDLHVTYLKAAKEGDDIIVSAKTLRAGKKLAFLECVLQKNDGTVIAKGNQTKFIDQ
ncbi:acyl-coenzyme A thioesterase 13-like isoform X2 [Anastrepha obliqua]|uniref:acyl-coenzyme A thioesterase 13-like isoform X2 n=1 Tax=Anastrepha obliqua TaxID=95512 RepID=UPI002409A293|nr:acyl-coenzyme A thioesterase 13-like isoform X2 [Anastrepha obliqua]